MFTCSRLWRKDSEGAEEHYCLQLGCIECEYDFEGGVAPLSADASLYDVRFAHWKLRELESPSLTVGSERRSVFIREGCGFCVKGDTLGCNYVESGGGGGGVPCVY